MRKETKSAREPAKQIGIWVRVSTEDQVKGESPEHHERRARYYAESKGWDVVTVYNLDTAMSGKSVMGFPETQRMLEDVRRGRVTGIIFSKLARLARNTRELLEFADIFRESGADLISLQEAIDTSTPAGRLFYTMIAAMAQWEREEIADRVAASVPVRAKMGKPLGGAAPFGYRWDGRELKPDEKEAPVRRFMYDLFLTHQRKKTVARLLNEAGHRTRNGSKFTDTTVDRLLRDPTAKGMRRANYTKSTGDKKHWTLKPESDWVLIPVQAIVPEEVWAQCNAVLDERRENGKRPARQTVHLFAGIAFCTCGAKMYVPSNSPKYICSQCRNKIPVEDLEAVFREQLHEFFLSSDALTQYIETGDRTIVEKRELLATLEGQRAKVQAEMDKVYKLYIADEISVEGFGRTYKPLEERLKQMDDQLPRLQAELDFLRIQHTSRDEIVSEAQDLYGHWSDLTPAEKRNIVENVAERITVGDGDIAIELHYLPSSAQIMATGQRGDIPALPFCHATLRAKKPKDSAYPARLERLGDHIRQRRLDLGLRQRDVATHIGVDKTTVNNWERNRTEPEFRHLPAITAFLGYVPTTSNGDSLGAALVGHRTLRGLSQSAFARELGVDAGTLGRWERDERVPTGWHLDRVLHLLG